MGTNQTTKETRRASYDAVIPKAKERSRLILETLGSRRKLRQRPSGSRTFQPALLLT